MSDNADVDENKHSTEAPSMLAKPLSLRVSLVLTWLGVVGLIVVFAVENLTEDRGAWLRWFIQCLPLLIFLPALLMQSHRGLSGLCFVVLMYFIAGVTGTMGPSASWSDWLLLVLSIILFFTATFSSRWLQRWRLAAMAQSA